MIECKVFVGNARAKISVRLFKVVRPEQVISICWPFNVQTQGVMRKESGQATALPLWGIPWVPKPQNNNTDRSGNTFIFRFKKVLNECAGVKKTKDNEYRTKELYLYLS